MKGASHTQTSTKTSKSKMASLLPSSLRFPLSSSSSSPTKPQFPRRLPSFTTRATEPETPPSDPDSTEPESPSGDNDFDQRMNEFRLRNRSGTGKKAEIRKSKKGALKSGSGSSVYLPPVPLKEPVSGGLKVDFGFSAYSERINGRIAILGLTALLLVELATGKGVINYHTPAIVLIQIYFVAAVSTLYIKYEKEKISVWPQSSSK